MIVLSLKSMISGGNKTVKCVSCGEPVRVPAGYTGNMPKCRDCRIDISMGNGNAVAYSEHAGFTVMNAAKISIGGKVI